MTGLNILVPGGVQFLFVTPKMGCMMVEYKLINAKSLESRKKGAERAQGGYRKFIDSPWVSPMVIYI